MTTFLIRSFFLFSCRKMEETYLFSCLMALVTLFNLMLFSNGKWWTIFQILDFQLYVCFYSPFSNVFSLNDQYNSMHDVNFMLFINGRDS